MTLNGTEGPNDGWLVVILSAAAILWARMLEDDSWRGALGAVGLLGASLVIVATALQSWSDSRRVLDASVGHGLLLVLAGGAVVAAVGAYRALALLRAARGGR